MSSKPLRAGFFGRLPIRHKLVVMIMGTSGAVLLLSSIGYLATGYYQSRNSLLRDLSSQAQLILESSTAALQSNDPGSAQKILQTLGTNEHIRTACVYLKTGALFSEFNAAPDSTSCPPHPPPDGYRFERDRLQLTRSMTLQGARAGSVLLRTDLDLVATRLRAQATIVTILLVATLGVALLMSARLQSIVSEPVSALARTAAEVSASGDYAVRADRRTEDELGTLVDSFNRMLERIQLREADLSRANEELRREVVERRRAEQERAELRVRELEANRLKDEFLATLSHELRTPLNAILGWTRLLRADAIPPAGHDRALEKIERNAEVQARLVEDMLKVSRLVSGKLILDLRPFDLETLMTTAIDSIRPTAEARGVTITTLYEPHSLPTAGDPVRLQRVIWNLLSNAVKFTPSGGAVTVELGRRGSHDEIVVRDTGIGIDPAFIANVFDTFRQGDGTSTRAHGGLGLGLSIVRLLVELHGGEVHASSGGEHHGSVFTVRLPVRAPDRDRLRPPSPAESDSLVGTSLFGTRILVVDDDMDTRDLLLTVLEDAGADVRAAASADEGLRACLELRPDAIVSDIAMPGKDGCDLMREIEASLGSGAPRVRIALTAITGTGDEERSAEAGFQRHMTKPFDPVALIRAIADLLAKGHAV